MCKSVYQTIQGGQREINETVNSIFFYTTPRKLYHSINTCPCICVSTFIRFITEHESLLGSKYKCESIERKTANAVVQRG